MSNKNLIGIVCFVILFQISFKPAYTKGFQGYSAIGQQVAMLDQNPENQGVTSVESDVSSNQIPVESITSSQEQPVDNFVNSGGNPVENDVSASPVGVNNYVSDNEIPVNDDLTTPQGVDSYTD